MSTTPDSFSPEALASSTPSELVRLLVHNEARVPRAVIDECARRGNEMLDELAALLEKDYYWGDDQTSGEWWLRLHAVMILGLFPDERAGELLVRYMRRIDEAGDDNLEDWLAGYWPALFRNKPECVTASLRALGSEMARSPFMRIEAINAEISRAQSPEACDDSLAWAAGIAFNEHEDYDLRVLAGNTILDFAPRRYRAALEKLADIQPRIGRMFSREDIEQAYASAPNTPDWERFRDPWAFYAPEEIAKRQIRWAEEALCEEKEALEAEREEPYVRALPKIGRNEFCPCGSGKKYKKCCMP